MFEIPRLETDRLILRAATMLDWPDYMTLMRSDRARYMGGPFTLHGAWGFFCHDLVQWSLFGHGALMIDEKESGKPVGQVGINYGPLFPEHELGWYLYDGWEGKGYAFEAAQAMKIWAFKTQRLKTLVSYIDPSNEPSRRLAERLGAALDPDAPRNDPNDLVYRHKNDVE